MKEVFFQNNILFGVATASTQIEGGNTDSNWNDWYARGEIKDGSDPARANDHYNRYREDIDLMASMNIQTYRMSLEWSRIEPKQNEFCQEALAHYAAELQYLRSKNIVVLLTLHHFNNPMWFERIGGFLNPQSSAIFLHFVQKVISTLGMYADEYVTINEPNVYVTSAYYFGEFPPGHHSLPECRTAMTNLCKAHISAYKLIHAMRRRMGFRYTKVGYASHVRVFEPRRKYNPLDICGARLMEKMFQTAIDTCAMTGVAKYPIKRDKFFEKGCYYDFIGINYYARSLVRVFTEGAKDDAPHNDMGWEIYPYGIRQVTERYYQRYKKPIYITENGTPDGADAFRTKFIYDHLRELSLAKADVHRYYHWTFIDNFEWSDGETPRFGLVALNYETQERTLRESGKFYAGLIKNHKITQELIDTYLERAD